MCNSFDAEITAALIEMEDDVPCPVCGLYCDNTIRCEQEQEDEDNFEREQMELYMNDEEYSNDDFDFDFDDDHADYDFESDYESYLDMIGS